MIIMKQFLHEPNVSTLNIVFFLIPAYLYQWSREFFKGCFLAKIYPGMPGLQANTPFVRLMTYFDFVLEFCFFSFESSTSSF